VAKDRGMNPEDWSAALARLSSAEFERLLTRHYWEQGYEVEHYGPATTGSRYDGGVDLVLRRAGTTALVQCKHWKVGPVPAHDVQQLLGLVDKAHAQRGILVVAGEFAAAAREVATGSGRIELVDGTALRAMIDPAALQAASSSATQRFWRLLGIGALAVAVFLLVRGVLT
jgi:restriction system protein